MSDVLSLLKTLAAYGLNGHDMALALNMAPASIVQLSAQHQVRLADYDEYPDGWLQDDKYLTIWALATRLFEPKCSRCGIDSWNNKPLACFLDRGRGSEDPANWRLLCPNCMSQGEPDGQEKDESVSHQKQRKLSSHNYDVSTYGIGVFDRPVGDYVLAQEEYAKEHREFIERYEYLGKVGNSPKWVFAARLDGILACVIMLNLPNSFSKILGENTPQWESLIQRGATASFAHQHLGSKMIRFACKWMVENTDKRIFYGYSDSLAGEIGTIYQAAGFEYLGAKFGAKFQLSHPEYKNGEPFNPQSLKRTSTLKKWCKDNGIPINPEWIKDNGFKDISKIDPEIKKRWYEWGSRLTREGTKIEVPAKGKYILVLGKDKREQRELDKLKTYTPQPYPKRKSSPE